MVKAMARYAETIGVNAPLIAFNGALIYDFRRKTPLEAREVPAEDATGGHGPLKRGRSRAGVHAGGLLL
jgi:hydroxymethylpyrimidine pyrophosphatase-like HAD family hydrolase